MNIHRPLLCPNCGRRVPISARTAKIGYKLAPTIKSSFDEGIVPIALTGRFLRNLTCKGFFWTPGLKYRREGRRGDIDIVACCDGLVVFAECKTLVDISSEADTWDDILAQFEELSSIAIQCHADLVILASQVLAYPERVLTQIESLLNKRIPYLLLDRNDLESGYRKDDEGRWISIQDFQRDKFSKLPIEREPR